MAEVVFVLQQGAEIIPVEVKSEKSVKSRSLAEYRKKCNPTYEVRTSMVPELILTPGFIACSKGTDNHRYLFDPLAMVMEKSDTVWHRPSEASWRSGRIPALPYPPLLASEVYHDW